MNLLKTNMVEFDQFVNFHWGQPGKIANDSKNKQLENCSVAICGERDALYLTWNKHSGTQNTGRKSELANFQQFPKIPK